MRCVECLESTRKLWWFKSQLGGLVGGFVIAGSAAGFTVQETVFTKANFEYSLAEATVLFAFALGFRHLALGATVFGGTGSGRHRNNVALSGCAGNVPLVTGRARVALIDATSVLGSDIPDHSA
jgi:hypothetical protein